ncbi:carboxypeptidase-like protein [Anseongella ginsenosidimutans]|uniref:Carboxypeptidase-like protein n=1 Tax=Anseongella ginsenosidimutans TaxID=496056 RepID=A0A4R3KLV5_9SPHI|nr:DUF5686 and carboxypeptidase regulatory-like domain-containing protein [Anseongella ginsenosidimutans]QEC54065.1 carboxypeptidase-like regulatory domain-containing protein [Anseongella ginsenosidimutans]TCS85170.1 carboxypeptidase-like protein [Anseongella ginsenosidimutans]
MIINGFKVLLFLAGICMTVLTEAQTQAQTYSVAGTVSDSLGEPVPFASVFVSGSSRGVTANENGFYMLRLGKGDWKLLFKSIGYRQETRPLSLSSDTVLDVRLSQERLRLETVAVTASREDPAYAIIRKAIARRQTHLRQEQNYAADVYIKGLQRMEDAPEKFLGMDVRNALELDSNNQGIVYLSESQSELFVKDPDTYKEIVYSSKVAGDNSGFSFNEASEMLFSFYQNLLLRDLNNRGFVSPVADNALFYYRYRLEGTFEESGYLVNKIAVIPRRRHDPVFRGHIYIMENNWRIHSLDLTLTRDAQLNFVDSLNIKQTFRETGDSLWMPATKRLRYGIKLLKFHLTGYFLGVFDNYRMPVEFEEGFFNNEVVRIEKGANEKDSAYWAADRPVPLTGEEREGYHEKDSIARLKETEAYLDSLDAKNNRFKIGKFIFPGYVYNDRFHKQSHHISPLLLGLQFNTVEGAALEMAYRYRKELEDGRSWSVSPRLRYGFSNHHFNPSAEAEYHYSPLHQASVGLRGGSEVADFNAHSPVNALVNSIFTLAAGRNLKKIYERRFLELFAGREVWNGLTLHTEIGYARRLPLVNTNYYSFRKEEDRRFEANDPLKEEGNAPAFAAHNALSWKVQADIVFGQQYKTLPDERWRLGSPWPRLRLSYTKGIPLAGSEVDYDVLSLSVYDRRVNLGLYGQSAFSLGGGGFLNNRSLYYMDAHQFSGNTDIYAGLNFDRFYLLGNYSAFSTDYFLEGHFEHNLEGFLLNKVPLLRQLKLRETVGVNYLYTENLQHYWELFLGVQKIGLKAGWAFSWGPDGKMSNGLRIGLGL